VLIACRVSDGFLWQVYAEEIPDGPEAATWRVDPAKFDAAVGWAFRTFRVVGFYADPPFFQDSITSWVEAYGSQLVARASQRDPISFWTNQPARMAPVLERLHTAISSGSVPISGGAKSSLKRHLINAQKVVDRYGKVLVKKVTPKSPLKIDSTPAAALAYQARADYLASTKRHKEAEFVPRRIKT
jgi:hypothetical protein